MEMFNIAVNCIHIHKYLSAVVDNIPYIEIEMSIMIHVANTFYIHLTI